MNQRPITYLQEAAIITLVIILLGQIGILAVPEGSSRPWNAVDPASLGDTNPFNGALNVSIPLISIAGRGEVQIPLILRLGKRWRTNYYYWLQSQGDLSNSNCRSGSLDAITYTIVCLEPDRTGTSPQPNKFNIYPSTTNEYDTGYGPGLLVGRTQNANYSSCTYPSTNGGNPGIGNKRRSSRFYLSFFSSDGAEHELVDQNTMGKFREDSASQCDQVSVDAQFSRGTTFISTDGSAMTFVSDTEFITDPDTSTSYGSDAPVRPSGMLYTANGVRYRFDGGRISYVTDRNGNKTTFTYTPVAVDGTSKLLSATDSIGRTVTIEYDIQDVAPYGLCDRITFSGMDGQPRVLRISKSNLNDNLRTGYLPQSINAMWNPRCDSSGGCSENISIYNPLVVSALWLPDGRSYKYKYNTFVEVARIESPTGEAVEYDHDYGNGPGWLPQPGYPLARKVVEKRVYSDSSTQDSLVSKTKYNRVISTISSFPSVYVTHVTIDQTDANNNLLKRAVSHFYGEPKYNFEGPQSYTPYGIPSWKDGQEYETDLYANDGTTLVGRTLKELSNRQVPWISNQDIAPAFDTRPTRQIYVTFENGQALAVLKKTEYDENGSSDPAYFSHLNIKRSKAYNYKVLDLNTAQSASLQTIASIFTENELASISEADYLYDAGYKARSILGLISETRILNPTNTSDILAKSQYLYDQTGQYYSMVDYGATVAYEAPTGTYAALRGDTTTTRTWIKDTDTWVEVHSQWDNFGHVRKTWDQSGDQSRFIETEYSSQYYYAYPTKTITPPPDPTGAHGTSESSNVQTSYDFWTGRPLTTTNSNGQVTSYEYDAQLRTHRVIPPAGGAITEYEYGDTPGNMYVKIRRQVDSQNWAETTTFADNLGRPVKSQGKDRQGDVFQEVEYDNFGRVKRTSNPYRTGEQKYWSKSRYDNQGRVVEIYAPALDGQTGASIGTIQFGISTVPGFIGNYETITDAAGRTNRTLTNVYGQIVRFDEPTAGNDVGPLDNPNLSTFYSYDQKGELIKIQQGQQNRYFKYDSLGRLVRTRQPEQIVNSNLDTQGNPENNQWTAGYAYDIYGNVITVTDAKGTVITNGYDKAGRVITRSYSDGVTPTINYFYDGAGFAQVPQFAKGNLTKVSNGISETDYTSFDNYGKVLTNQQITDGQTYAFGYKYDDKGRLIEETYPSLRVVKNHYDIDGVLGVVSSRTANSDYKNYASDFDFSSNGQIRAMMLGNGRWETASYNERSQVTQIGLGASPTDTSLWKVSYDYGELNTDSSVDTNKNTGLVARQTINIPATTFVQTYKYDELSRLTEAKEMAGSVSGTENWKQTFGYDRFGNRIARYQKLGQDVLPTDNKTLPQVDPNTNRFTTGQGYIYDFNGNIVQDANNRAFTYDGDDKQTIIRDLNIPTTNDPDANVIGRYYYDGEGKRVKKVSNTETTVFVYDAGGDLAAEYSTQTNSQPTTSFLTTDNLGSPRVVTDSIGNVISRRDFLPFGEDLLAGVGARATNQKYSSSGIDNIRQRYTGYQKDLESDLDFAEARMYRNLHGRFTSPDPLLSSTSLENPQTFNRYAYVGNNPVNLTDPSGLNWCTNGNHGVFFTGDGQPCNNDYPINITGQEWEVSGDWSSVKGGGIFDHTNVLLKADGSVEVRPLRQQRAASQPATNSSTATQAATNPAATTAAATAAPSSSSDSGTGETEIPQGPPTIIDGLVATTVSAGGTIAEDTGITAVLKAAGVAPPDTEFNTAGRWIGHGLAIVQAGIELEAAFVLIAGGTGGEIFGFALDSTGVGALIGVPANVISTTAIATGAAVGLHGAFTLFNTAANIKNQATGGESSKYTPEDVDRMKQGKPPIGDDGNPMELHHEGQEPNGTLKEMTRTDHRGPGNYTKNHPNGNKTPSKIDRNQFKKEREQYWKNKAKNLE